MTIVEAALGPDHPKVAFVLNDLALLYSRQDRHAEAEPLYLRALTTRNIALPPDHPDLAASLGNYATLLRETGRPDKAEKLESRARTIRAKHAEQNPAGQ
jgi:tetratricopeptide (TPR) repeat protein